MSLETAANPAGDGTATPNAADQSQTGANTPAEGTSEGNEDGDDLDDLLLQAAGSEDDTPTDDEFEVEYEGKTYKVPAELKDALLRQSDYTRKTTDLAEQRKAVEATAATYQQASQISQERFEATVALKSLEGRIAQLTGTVVDGMSQEQVNALRLELMTAQQHAGELQTFIADRSQAESNLLGQHQAKAREAALKEAAKVIPNFDQKRQAELDSFVVSLGGQPGSVSEMADPLAWQLVHLAHIGKQFIDRKRKVTAVTNAQAAPSAREVGGKANASKDPEKMSTEEWMKHREKQLQPKKK